MDKDIKEVLANMAPDVCDITITNEIKNDDETHIIQGFFKSRSLMFSFYEKNRENLHILSLNLSFNFQIEEKKARQKINDILLAFNKSNAGVKASLMQQNKEEFSIMFTHEAFFSSSYGQNVRESICNAIIPVIGLCPLIFSNELKKKNINHRSIVKAVQ